jgi:hypothetical protein
MDQTLVVFVVGTSVSFLPMYWLTAKLLGHRRRPARSGRQPLAGGDSAARGEFMNLLRQEVASRAVMALRDALIEAKHAAHDAAGSRVGPSTRTRQRLEETRWLVNALFPLGPREAYGRGLETVASATSQSIGSASAAAAAAHAAFEQALRDRRSGPTRTATSQFWNSIWHKCLGWIGTRRASTEATALSRLR